jgi:2,4-dienoyl-CoA reductase-like NADH-dependent reductase (Old Yellow Enzyme family)
VSSGAAPYPRVASLKTTAAFRDYVAQRGIRIDLDNELDSPGQSPLAQPFELDGARVGNRFCILPMEGWDGTSQGEPTDLTERRWRRFGMSGAKLIWGGEAVAVRHDGRANPHQLLLTASSQPAIASLRETLVAAHRDRFGSNADGDLLIGLQLTHSGRYARPDDHDGPRPLAGTSNAILDRRFPSGVPVIGDGEIDSLVDHFVAAAKLAHEAGFAFVDIKQCHGYLGHELLGARARSGRYGGTFENRTRFLMSVIDGIGAAVPGLRLAVRLSAFDTVPYRKGSDGVGIPEPSPGGPALSAGFGILTGDDLDSALEESRALLARLEARNVRWICVTAGSPYYNPHVQRPALFPPVDGYRAPEDPLRGVARQIEATARLKASFPRLAFVGSAYSYLQEWLPHVAQRSVRTGLTDFVGLGRIALSYPDLPADLLCGRRMRRESFCRTFSDCTTGPRLGLVSGCYPLDPFYAGRTEAAEIRNIRTKANT